ncbi:hypothetical protein C8R44DRAFT_801168 [Mycena epipterygia]|nr:hypothetical protein C8R44DRAFT_801168 [Mycena epipterygia]
MSTLSDSQRSWWSLSQKSPSSSQVFPPEKPHSQSKQSGIKFNALATAMGFKPKRTQPPPLTIQDPPYAPVRTASTSGGHLAPRVETHHRRPYTAPSLPSPTVGRPPSNSVSSSRSRVDSLEPTTPRTPDDVARARRGSLLTLSDTDPFAARVVSLHSPSDPNRLSAFSNSSATDTKSNHSANRVSYASSSSQSRFGGDLSPLSILSPASEVGSSYMKLSNKKSGHSLRRKDMSSDSTWLSNLGGDSNRFSQPDPPPKPRPAMRARGMTDGGIDRSNFLRNDPFLARTVVPSSSASHSSTAPARKPSLSHPTAPPSHELPPPPRSGDDQGLDVNSAGSASSTSLTFSAEFVPISHNNSRSKAKQSYDMSPKPAESGWEPDPPRTSPRTLRKSISHQSLSKRGQSPSSSSSTPVPMPDPATIKVPRKQRSFHQHRVPVPPVPLQLPLSDQRASDPGISSRRRLFSGSSSRRPSQSTIALTDDARSLNAAPEPDRTASSSCWIDTGSVHEYTPQQIMSPAEMLKVEASVDAAYKRPRKESIVSTSGMSDFEHDFGLSSLSFSGGRPRPSSDHPSVRTSTSDHAHSSQDMFYLPMAPQPPSPPVLMSLPPPPRRTKPRTGSLSRSPSEHVAPLSPPSRKNLRPKISVEERRHRQSILRKPSFLDIEDEMDKEPALMRQGSFLDLTRGSFDSVRSVDTLDYN